MTIAAAAIWEPTVLQVTTFALREAGMLHIEHQPSVAQLAAARDALPFILQGMQEQGPFIRAIERYAQATTARSATITAPADTLSIEQGAVVRGTDGLDHPLELLTPVQYQAINDKSTEDMPLWYTAEQGSDDRWTISLFPIPTVDWPTIVYPRARRLRDVDSDNVTLDVPRSHLRAVGWMLGATFARNANRRTVATELDAKAEGEIEKVTGNQTPRGNTSFEVPDIIERDC